MEANARQHGSTTALGGEITIKAHQRHYNTSISNHTDVVNVIQLHAISYVIHTCMKHRKLTQSIY